MFYVLVVALLIIASLSAKDDYYSNKKKSLLFDGIQIGIWTAILFYEIEKAFKWNSKLLICMEIASGKKFTTSSRGFKPVDNHIL